MEPIRNTLTARFQNLRMYREDLDALVAAFQKTCETVTISDKEYRYDSLDEMKQKGQTRIKVFDIRGEHPSVHFLVNQKSLTKIPYPQMQPVFNELRTEEISPEADAFYYFIKDYLTKYQRPNFRLWCIFPLAVTIAGTFWFALHNAGVNAQGQQTIGSPVGFCISFGGFFVFLATALNVSTYLSLETKRNFGSFFIRNREEFARYAVTALIWSLVGGLVVWLFGHLHK